MVECEAPIPIEGNRYHKAGTSYDQSRSSDAPERGFENSIVGVKLMFALFLSLQGNKAKSNTQSAIGVLG